MLNLSIRECERAVVETLNSFSIPIEAKRLILQNVLNAVVAEANKQVNEEASVIINKKKEENVDAEGVQ